MAETKGNILKVRLGNDTRRQLLYNANISYNDLVLMLQRIFGGKLQPTDDVTLKYFDEDDDLITIIDGEDFAHAREYSQTGVVKMVIYINGKDTRTSINGGTVTGIRKELSQVRDKVNSMIDCLSGTQLSGMELDPAVEESTQKTFEEVVQAVETTNAKPVSSATISIFDPYTTPATTTAVLPTTESTSTVTSHPVITSNITGGSPINIPSSSSSTTSHLFQGHGGGESSTFLDQTNQSSGHVSTHQTGQMGVPQTGQHPPQSNPPTAPPNSSSPKPPQAPQSGYSAGYPPGQSTGYQTGSSYATGQVNFPTSQSGYQTGQSGYTGSQTGQGAYQTGYTGAYGSTYPPQSSAPTPPSSSTQYPPSTTPTPGQYQPGPPYNPATYGQTPSQYAPGQNPPPGTYPMAGGAGRGSRVTAYGQAPYKVGY